MVLLRLAPLSESRQLSADAANKGFRRHFSARNAHVRILEDTSDAWDRWSVLDLDGFEYHKLSSPSTSVQTRADNPYLRDARWFKDWLEGMKTYSPQPYSHLSALLRREGQIKTAKRNLIRRKGTGAHSSVVGRNQALVARTAASFHRLRCRVKGLLCTWVDDAIGGSWLVVFYSTSDQEGRRERQPAGQILVLNHIHRSWVYARNKRRIDSGALGSKLSLCSATHLLRASVACGGCSSRHYSPVMTLGTGPRIGIQSFSEFLRGALIGSHGVVQPTRSGPAQIMLIHRQCRLQACPTELDRVSRIGRRPLNCPVGWSAIAGTKISGAGRCSVAKRSVRP